MPLGGLRVIDAATLFAGPLAATMLGDFGADVIKIEHPELGDPARSHGHDKDGVGLWWKLLGRNKRPMTLDLGRREGADILLRLAESADVLIENFRPGTMQRWGLGYEDLKERNPGIVVASVTGFGQEGPYASRPGFGTLAESMSGFAHVTGPADGPPTLPPFGLADGIAGLTTAFAIMVALEERRATGVGQHIDLAITDPILTVVGAAPIVYDQLGIIQQRMGNQTKNNAPRNTYRTSDNRWIAISTSARSVAERVMRLVGMPEVTEEPWFETGSGRAGHAELLDSAVATWVAERTRDEAMQEMTAADAAVAPIYDAADILDDPQFQARGTITTVPDDELGPIRMQNVLFRLSRTPGAIKWSGRKKGSSTNELLAELGISEDEQARLRQEGVL